MLGNVNVAQIRATVLPRRYGRVRLQPWVLPQCVGCWTRCPPPRAASAAEQRGSSPSHGQGRLLDGVDTPLSFAQLPAPTQAAAY